MVPLAAFLLAILSVLLWSELVSCWKLPGNRPTVFSPFLGPVQAYRSALSSEPSCKKPYPTPDFSPLGPVTSPGQGTLQRTYLFT